MKKISIALAPVLILVLLLGSIGCAGDEATPTPVPTAAPVATSTPTAAPATPTPTAGQATPTPVRTATPAPALTAAPSTPTPAPAATPTPEPAIKKQTWKLSLGYPIESDRGRVAQKFSDLVTELSGGQIKVDIFPSSTLFTPARELDAITSGAIQVALTPPYYMQQPVPFFSLSYIEGFWEGYDHQMAVVNNAVWNKAAEQGLARAGAKFVGATPGIMTSAFITNVKEVKRATDLKDMKYGRATGGTPTPILLYTGMKSIVVSSTELVTAFQQGIIDVYSTGLTTYEALRVWEWAKYMLVISGTSAPSITIVMMNPNAWNALPASFQETITSKIIPELKEFANGMALSMENAAIDKFRKNGMIVNIQAKEDSNLMRSVIMEMEQTKKILATSPQEVLDAVNSVRPSKS